MKTCGGQRYIGDVPLLLAFNYVEVFLINEIYSANGFKIMISSPFAFFVFR